MRMTPGVRSILPLLVLAGQARADRNEDLARGEDLYWLTEAKGERLSRGFVEGVVDAPPDRVFEAITDYDHYAKFMPRTENTRVLKRADRSLRYKCKLDMPWPVSDVSYQADVSWDVHRRTIRFRMAPEKGDGVRSFDGSWRLAEFRGDAGRTLVRYDILFEPETEWPKWVMDIGTKATLGDILPSLRRRIRQLDKRSPR